MAFLEWAGGAQGTWPFMSSFRFGACLSQGTLVRGYLGGMGCLRTTVCPSEKAQCQGPGDRGRRCALQVCVHAVVCVYVLRGLGKLFSRMFSEPQGPGKSQHGL